MSTAHYVKVEPPNRPVWYMPQQASASKLRVRNSLTESLDEFVPHEGNRVRWYTCEFISVVIGVVILTNMTTVLF